MTALVERTKMALAEAGYPDADVEWKDDGGLSVDGTIPHAVAWRACEIAWASVDAVRPPCCEACSAIASELNDIDVYRACLADRPLVRDCGVTR